MSHMDLEQAKQRLASGEYTCVLCREGETVTSTQRGVRPLVRWLTEGTDLRGFSAADKVVGKATAFLYCLLGVKAVYARVMSKSARQVLLDSGIHAEQETLVEYIINRAGDGYCPFETAVLEISDSGEALSAIRAKMQEMNITL